MKAKERVFGNLVRYKPTKYVSEDLGIVIQPYEARELDTFWMAKTGKYRLERIDFLDVVGVASLEQLEAFDAEIEAWNVEFGHRSQGYRDVYLVWKAHLEGFKRETL